MIPVRQSTAFECSIGPVLDADGVAVTGGVVGDFKIKKTTGNFAALNGSATLTHVSAGTYDLVLTTSDTDTVGLCSIAIDDTTNACAPLYLQVVEEAIYDMFFAASATGLIPANVTQWLGQAAAAVTNNGVPEVDITHIGGVAVSTSTAQLGVNVVNFGGSAGTFASGIPAVNATQFSGDAAPADALEALYDTDGPHPQFGIVDQGTAQSASATGLVLRAGAAFADTTLVGMTLAVHGSTQGYWQTRVITANLLSGDAVTVATWTVTPSGTITYRIFGSAPGASLADIADAVWDEDATGHQTQGTFGQAIGDPAADANTIYGAVVTGAAGATVAADIIAVKAETATILADTNELQTDWVNGGRLDLLLDDVATTSEVNAAAANVSVDEIQATALADLFNTDSATTYASAVAGSVVKEIADNAGGSALTEAGIADAVWDEALAGHAGAGSAGEALSAAGTAGDPWTTALPGAYGAGTAGKIVGDNLNATVSSRASQTSVDDLPTNAELTTALGTADDANLAAIAAVDAKIDTIDNFLDTEVAAILAAVDTEVAAVKAKTDSLTFTVAAELDVNVQSINGTALTGNGGGTPWNAA
jgi:hypothetical protein